MTNVHFQNRYLRVLLFSKKAADRSLIQLRYQVPQFFALACDTSLRVALHVVEQEVNALTSHGRHIALTQGEGNAVRAKCCPLRLGIERLLQICWHGLLCCGR